MINLQFNPSDLGSIPLVNSANDRSGHAAILVPLMIASGEWSLLLTKRAETLRQHGGEVAFPGGMWEQGDHFPLNTALREAEEEIALPSSDVEVKGLLPALSTRQGIPVSPVVATLSSASSLIPSPAEIESIFFVPIHELLKDHRIRTDIFHYEDEIRWAPAYLYQGYEIWGFTAGVIKMLLEFCFGATLPRQHTAPEKVW